VVNPTGEKDSLFGFCINKSLQLIFALMFEAF